MVQRYYIHPMAFGAVKNPGYGHVEVVKYEDCERLLAVSRSLLGLIGDDAILPNDFVDEMFNLGVL